MNGCDIGTVAVTRHGNKLRRFDDGWSPLTEDGQGDRWTVYTDDELPPTSPVLCRTTIGG